MHPLAAKLPGVFRFSLHLRLEGLEVHLHTLSLFTSEVVMQYCVFQECITIPHLTLQDMSSAPFWGRSWRLLRTLRYLPTVNLHATC